MYFVLYTDGEGEQFFERCFSMENVISFVKILPDKYKFIAITKEL